MRTYFHRAAILGLPANVLVLPLAGVMLNAGVAAIALSYVSCPLRDLLPGWPLLRCTGRSLPAFTLPISCRAVESFQILVRFSRCWRQRESFWPWSRSGGIAPLHLQVWRRCLFPAAWLRSIIPQPEPKAATWRSRPSMWARVIPSGGFSRGTNDADRRRGKHRPVHSEFDFGEDVVAPYLWARGLEHLDVVALTHAHGDHIGGLPASWKISILPSCGWALILTLPQCSTS